MTYTVFMKSTVPFAAAYNVHARLPKSTHERYISPGKPIVIEPL
jgi:hypothetical protein